MLRIDSREVRMEAGDQLSGYCSNLSRNWGQQQRRWCDVARFWLGVSDGLDVGWDKKGTGHITPRFWPEQWKEGLAIRRNKKSVLQQTLFLSLLKNYHLPQEAFADSSPVITPSIWNCNSTAVMYICLCTLALWRVTNHCNFKSFCPPTNQFPPP